MGQVEGSLHAKTQLDSSSCYETTPAFDGQNDRQTDGRTDGHITTTAYTALAYSVGQVKMTVGRTPVTQQSWTAAYLIAQFHYTDLTGPARTRTTRISEKLCW